MVCAMVRHGLQRKSPTFRLGISFWFGLDCWFDPVGKWECDSPNTPLHLNAFHDQSIVVVRIKDLERHIILHDLVTDTLGFLLLILHERSRADLDEGVSRLHTDDWGWCFHRRPT